MPSDSPAAGYGGLRIRSPCRRDVRFREIVSERDYSVAARHTATGRRVFICVYLRSSAAQIGFEFVFQAVSEGSSGREVFEIRIIIDAHPREQCLQKGEHA